MDPTIANIIVAGTAGFGGGGVVTPIALGLISPVVIRGNAESEGGLRPRPLPRCYPLCPPLFGVLVAVTFWLVFGPPVDAAGVTVAAGAFGFFGGTAGGTSSVCVQSLSGRP